jgi:deazaflavin-dependent oxidoreductase (nitroreductase family)
MTATLHPQTAPHSRPAAPAPPPRFGGLLWRVARFTSPVTMPLAGKRWNPIFAVLEHEGRKTGRRYATPVAARRIARGFVIALAFGAQVDWYRNVVVTGGATIRWRDEAYRVTAPQRIDLYTALAAFNPIQRLLLRMARVDGYVRVDDAETHDR